MEYVFLALLLVLMASALGSGYPVAFALPGSAILTIGAAAAAGYFLAGDVDAYFFQDGPSQWLSAGVTNLRGVYWEVERRHDCSVGHAGADNPALDRLDHPCRSACERN